jgi:HAD superfamily hydrolase (TIGR01509 family)
VQLKALILDFDGLLLETEGPLFQSWSETFAQFGAELTLEEWSLSIGTADDLDPFDELERRVGRHLDRKAVQSIRRARRDELLEAMPPSEGVSEMIDQANQLGLKIAIASSSPTPWVETHLTRLGLRDHFDQLSCFDGVGAPKPAPDLYLHSIRALNADPNECLAFEDSYNGLLAAKAARLRCVVVPTAMTRHMDFGLADLVVPSLGNPPLKLLIPGLKES